MVLKIKLFNLFINGIHSFSNEGNIIGFPADTTFFSEGNN